MKGSMETVFTDGIGQSRAGVYASLWATQS
jgi:hypothetical protein